MYANEEMFNVKYNAELDRLEVKKPKKIKKVMEFIGCHKLITTSAIMFVLFSFVNFVLIYNFMEILKNV